MADHFYGVNKGSSINPQGSPGGVAVTSGTSTTSKSMELRLLDGAGLTKQDVLNALESIKSYLLRTDTFITP